MFTLAMFALMLLEIAAVLLGAVLIVARKLHRPVRPIMTRAGLPKAADTVAAHAWRRITRHSREADLKDSLRDLRSGLMAASVFFVAEGVGFVLAAVGVVVVYLLMPVDG